MGRPREHAERRQQTGSRLCLPQEVTEGPGQGPEEAVASPEAALTGNHGDKAQLPTRPAPWKPGRGRSETSLSPDSQFPPPHESVLPAGHASKARFLSCGASGHLRGSTPARCSAGLHLQASYRLPHSTCQGRGLVGSGHGAWQQPGARLLLRSPGPPTSPTGSPRWGSPEAAMQTPEPSALASGGRRGFVEGHRESQCKARMRNPNS